MSGVRVYDDADALHTAAAAVVAAAAAAAIARRGRFLLVLAGGRTPQGVYERLAAAHADGVDWARVHLFWGDERCVPPAHAASNYGLAAATLLGRVAVPAAQVHRIRGELPAAEAAAAYDAELRGVLGADEPARLAADAASFDLVLLGVGADGHTASLFPGSAALEARTWAAAAEAPPDAEVRARVTLTLDALGTARDCLVLATGAAKRAAVAAALAPGRADASPAGRVRPRGSLLWLVDRAAAPSE